MVKIPYWQQLQDPRWQKLRLEVMQRDGFACTCCGEKTKQLQIHHRWYVGGRMAWEAPLVALNTLCLDCHKMAGEISDYKQDWEGLIDDFEGDKNLCHRDAFLHWKIKFKISGQRLGAAILKGLISGEIDPESISNWEEAHKKWLVEYNEDLNAHSGTEESEASV